MTKTKTRPQTRITRIDCYHCGEDESVTLDEDGALRLPEGWVWYQVTRSSPLAAIGDKDRAFVHPAHETCPADGPDEDDDEDDEDDDDSEED